MYERGRSPTSAVAHLDRDRARADLRAEMFLPAGDGGAVVIAVDGRGVAEPLRARLDPVLPKGMA